MLGYCPKLGMFLQHEIFIHNQYFVTRKWHHSLEASEKGPEKCGLSQPHICNQCMSLKSSYQPEFQSHYKSYFAGNRQKWGFYQVGNLHDRCKVAELRQQFSSEAKVCCHSDLLSMWEGLLLDNPECDLQAHLRLILQTPPGKSFAAPKPLHKYIYEDVLNFCSLQAAWSSPLWNSSNFDPLNFLCIITLIKRFRVN